MGEAPVSSKIAEETMKLPTGTMQKLDAVLWNLKGNLWNQELDSFFKSNSTSCQRRLEEMTRRGSDLTKPYVDCFTEHSDGIGRNAIGDILKTLWIDWLPMGMTIKVKSWWNSEYIIAICDPYGKELEHVTLNTTDKTLTLQRWESTKVE